MKFSAIYQMVIGLFISTFLISCLAAPVPGQAQEGVDVEQVSKPFSREELAQMLAPVALYPDPLLSQVLMASTYPIEVVEADRWVKGHPGLTGDALDSALLSEDWDPSVKALCHFPRVLSTMSERIGETTNIGNAFLAQEDDVMNMVQELRAKAYAQGNLKTTGEQKVVVEKETIIIEPANPRVVYVPYYDPLYVYGPWWYPAYPPYYWGPSHVSIGVGVSFWPGIFFGFTFGDWSYFDWHRHYIYINVHHRPRYVRHNRWIADSGRWRHLPHHRRGVAYRDIPTARRYGQYPKYRREYDRRSRGFPEHRERRTIGGRAEQQGLITRPGERPRTERERERQHQTIRQRGEEHQTIRQRVEQERQIRERADRDRRERQQRIERDRQVRERAEQQRQPQRMERERQRVEQQRQPQRMERERQRVEQPRQQPRQRVEQQRQIQRQPAPQGSIRQRAEQQRQIRERVDRNIFNRVGEGRRESESSRRGQFSRGGESRGRSDGGGRSRGDGRGRGDRDRIRR